MSVSPVSPSAAATIQQLARTIMDRFDANQDNQLSFGEFASFLEGFANSATGGSSASRTTNAASATNLFLTTDSAAAAGPARTMYRDRMLGFDASSIKEGTGSSKYDAAVLLQYLDPNDSTAMQRVYEELNRRNPGSVSIDIHNDLMLDGDKDGYIGRRPLDRSENWDNPPSGWVWQWLWYNDSHPGPDGQTA